MHPSDSLRLSMLVLTETFRSCESCCYAPFDFVVYESFVCRSCAEVA